MKYNKETKLYERPSSNDLAREMAEEIGFVDGLGLMEAFEVGQVLCESSLQGAWEIQIETMEGVIAVAGNKRGDTLLPWAEVSIFDKGYLNE